MSLSGSTADDVVILQATPLGNERRWANALGRKQLLGNGTPPSAINLLPMAPNTFYQDVSKFTGHLKWPGPPADTSIWSIRHLQESMHDPINNTYGIPYRRHEPPRRPRVAGHHHRVGAKFIMVIDTCGAPTPLPFIILELDLYPTGLFQGRGTDLGNRTGTRRNDATGVVERRPLPSGGPCRGAAYDQHSGAEPRPVESLPVRRPERRRLGQHDSVDENRPARPRRPVTPVGP
ncbi:MAG: hypothetical protein KDB53_17685 [Planctomycetes bacterium]|nr:hypothetical protein [Planctomycetota bacterium]